MAADPVASAVRLMMINRQFWEEQARDLDNMLRAITRSLDGAKNWPTDPRILANTLRQLAPSLLKIGIDVSFHKSRDRDRKRLITITASRPTDAPAVPFMDIQGLAWLIVRSRKAWRCHLVRSQEEGVGI